MNKIVNPDADTKTDEVKDIQLIKNHIDTLKAENPSKAAEYIAHEVKVAMALLKAAGAPSNIVDDIRQWAAQFRSFNDIREEAKEVGKAWRHAKNFGESTDQLKNKCFDLVGAFFNNLQPGLPSFDYKIVRVDIDLRVLNSRHGPGLLRMDFCPVKAVIGNYLNNAMNGNKDKVVELKLFGHGSLKIPRGWYDNVVHAILSNPAYARVAFNVQPHAVLPDTLWSPEFQRRCHFNSKVLVPGDLEKYLDEVLSRAEK